ncbi:hypothetical protein [Arthrobacter sp. H5]|uniref:hypothetical protein n=1 Tax=Arthrobacter sp. H5 TaxID=1267973 RepID=UPI0004B33B6B|nr:hypothetical protein [Arthrobacter sp. H5]
MSITPSVIVFDVNETLSDMGPLADAFTRAGVPASLARLWFTEVFRDGFALTSAGDNPAFADLATDSLHRVVTQTLGPGDYLEQVDSIMGVFTNLSLHPDAAPGILALSRITELITLSNGGGIPPWPGLRPGRIFAAPQCSGRSPVETCPRSL